MKYQIGHNSRFAQRTKYLRLAMRRTTLLILALIPACTPTPDQPTSKNDTQPNVIWILIDTLRPDHLGAYEYERNTSPIIDELAENGVLFENHYAQGVNTLLSVPTLLTGKLFPVFMQDKHHLDVWFLKNKPDDEIFASELFKQNGYTTAMFCASPWYTEKSRIAKSFDHFEPMPDGYFVTTSDFRAQNPGIFEWIDRVKGQPFFAYIHTLDAHAPRSKHNTITTWLGDDVSPERDAELRVWGGAPFNENDKNHIRNLYDGGIAYADYTIGEILKQLEQSGIRDNTIIIISSDHGETLGEDNNTLGHPPHNYSDRQLRVPLIINGPGIPKGKRISPPTQNIDLMPTLADLLHLQHSVTFDGNSLRAHMQGQPTDNKDQSLIYAKAENIYVTADPVHIVMDEKTKYVFRGLHEENRAKTWTEIEEITTRLSLPDHLETRNQSPPSQQTPPPIQSYVTDFLTPRWKQYTNLSTSTPATFQVPHWQFLFPDHVTDANDANDNKWTIVIDGNPFTPSNSNFYLAYNSTESPPEIPGIRNVPNGSYQVSILCQTIALDGRQRITSFHFRTKKLEEPKLYSLEPKSEQEPAKEYVVLGNFEVVDGKFYYHINPGRPEDMTFISGFRFRDLSQPQEKDIDVDHINEQLKALGYLN